MKAVDAFNSAQRSAAAHGKALNGLTQEYQKCKDKLDFLEDFLNHFNRVLLIFKREPAAERVVEFAVKFAAASTEV